MLFVLRGVNVTYNRPFVGSGHMIHNLYAGTQFTQWDFQNQGKSGWTGASSFVLKSQSN